MRTRQKEIAQFAKDASIAPLLDGGLSDELCDRFVENAIGRFALPLGVATNFLINGQEYVVPMAVEEPSVIAAASNAARMVRASGGFIATLPRSNTVAQIELRNATQSLLTLKGEIPEIIRMANDTQPQLVQLGGGVVDVVLRENVGGPARHVVHLVVNCLDAMGANMVNTMAEAVAPFLAMRCGATPGLKILSNLADQRLVRAECRVAFLHLKRNGFGGEDVAKGVAAASAFAEADPWRAATHNKGIFNGIDPVLVATGNDWRAVEAGGHAFAVQEGQYKPLATWHIEDTHLIGKLEMPMAVGIVGGASKAHPAAAKCLEIMGIESAAELAVVVASAGLASNLAALSALSTEGIQAGHMRLHSRRV
ncbi:MAG: hydroxymethylglutaryl-CoA reductase, degradative [Deltaproteobacteria bacterium]|nr:hydroxymethylglutaryl-CoA reductase, degradative [Deltaproteobacteria bacterium]